MTPTYYYHLKKSPFNCGVVGSQGLCIAIPNKYKEHKKIKVFYLGEEILEITDFHKQSIAHRHQPNKWGGGTFLMSYFKVVEKSDSVN